MHASRNLKIHSVQFLYFISVQFRTICNCSDLSVPIFYFSSILKYLQLFRLEFTTEKHLEV
uniref:Uncharacterized protein n=1 Tax=Aegilops tauschii subsp. strangulata TaxID=200361 RepID=A0A453FD47_AEGTS